MIKPELDRIKGDLETMQKAMGLAPSLGRDSLQWMKRNKWFSLWYCLPGVILIAASLLPIEQATRYWGLVPGQWAGIFVSAVMLGIAVIYVRKVTANDGRSEGTIREARRICGITSEGWCWSLALTVQLLLYFLWGKQYRIAFEPFWAGLFILLGSSCLITAVSAKVWTLLGWAIPFLAYGLSLGLVEGPGRVNGLLGHAHGKISGVMLGLMFIAVAVSFSIIQAWHIRGIESQHDTD